jgi:hypothetical protein
MKQATYLYLLLVMTLTTHGAINLHRDGLGLKFRDNFAFVFYPLLYDYLQCEYFTICLLMTFYLTVRWQYLMYLMLRVFYTPFMSAWSEHK